MSLINNMTSTQQTILTLISNITSNLNANGYLDQTNELKKLKNFDKHVELLNNAALIDTTKIWHKLIMDKIFLGMPCDMLLTIANNDETLRWLGDVVELHRILHKT